MKSVLLSTLLLVPFALAGCAGDGASVGDSGVVYPDYYYDSAYYGPPVGTYYYNYGPYPGHHFHHERDYRSSSTVASVHSGSHFNTNTHTTRVASTAHSSSSGHVSASAHVGHAY